MRTHIHIYAPCAVQQQQAAKFAPNPEVDRALARHLADRDRVARIRKEMGM